MPHQTRKASKSFKHGTRSAEAEEAVKEYVAYKKTTKGKPQRKRSGIFKRMCSGGA